MPPARQWRVTVVGMPGGATIPPSKASTHAEAAAVYRKMVPNHDHYIIRVHRLGDHYRAAVEFPAVKRVAA